MKKIIFGWMLFNSLCLLSIAQDSGVKFFEGDWKQALEQAAKEHKMIFIDCNTSWCGPCKQLAKNVFPQKKVGDFYNTHFINVSMDMEKGMGPALARHYGIKAYPTMLFLKPGGYQVAEVVGLKDADSLVLCGQEALVHADSLTWGERFDKGSRDSLFLRDYFMNMMVTQPIGAAQAAIDTIIQQEGFDAFYQKKYWDIICLAGISSPLSIWFAKHVPEFSQRYGEEAVSWKLAELYLNKRVLDGIWHAGSRDTMVFANYKKMMEERNLPHIAFLESMFDFYVAGKKGELDKCFAIAEAALAGGRPWQYMMLSRWADWMTVAQFDYRYRAAKWAAKGAEMTDDKELKDECIRIADALLNDLIPSAYPAPKLYGTYI